MKYEIAFANMAHLANRELSEGGTSDEAIAEILRLATNQRWHEVAGEATEERIVAGIEKHAGELKTIMHREQPIARDAKRAIFIVVSAACAKLRGES